jgi:hypothetical protein
VPPKLRKAPGVVAGGISPGPEITRTLCPAFRKRLGTWDFHCPVYLVSTLSKSIRKILAISVPWLEVTAEFALLDWLRPSLTFTTCFALQVLLFLLELPILWTAIQVRRIIGL